MKKVFFLFVAVSFLFSAAAIASVAQEKPKPTLSELQWQLKAIETQFELYQEKIRNLQIQYKEVKEQIDKMAPPAPKAEPKSLDVPKDEKKKK